MTRHTIRTMLIAGALIVPSLASAQGYGRHAVQEPDATGSFYRVTPPQPYAEDTGSDQDRRPDLLPYQRGGGQQTGGPARNLIPGDNLHISPR